MQQRARRPALLTTTAVRRSVCARCQREGLEVTREPVDEVWGVREFHVRHPDGRILRIGTGTEEE